MKIAGIAVSPFKVPVPDPHRSAQGVIALSPLVAITLSADDGTEGHALLFAYTEAALAPLASMTRNLAALLEGEPLAPASRTASLLARLRLLGAEPKPIRRDGAIGYDGVEGSAAAAERLARVGFLGVTVKIGYPTLAEDLATVRAIHAAIGSDIALIALMVYDNQSLDPTEAGACDCWMPDVMKCHGITGWMRVPGLAAAFQGPLSNHLWPEVSAQMMCAAATPSWLDYCDWWNPALAEPLRMTACRADNADVAGTGIAFDRAALAAHAA